MNAVAFLRQQHKKDLPATRLQEDVNKLLEDVENFIREEERHESDSLVRLNEINVDLVLSGKALYAHHVYSNYRGEVHARLSNPHKEYRELRNGGRVFSGAKGIEEKPIYFRVDFGKIYTAVNWLMRQLKF